MHLPHPARSLQPTHSFDTPAEMRGLYHQSHTTPICDIQSALLPRYQAASRLIRRVSSLDMFQS